MGPYMVIVTVVARRERTKIIVCGVEASPVQFTRSFFLYIVQYTFMLSGTTMLIKMPLHTVLLNQHLRNIPTRSVPITVFNVEKKSL